MPTYQYVCTACNHDFETFQAFSDNSLTHCPVCDGEVRKVYSAVGVVFKGSGFYKTDSKSESKSSLSPAAAPVAPKEAPTPKAAPEVSKSAVAKKD